MDDVCPETFFVRSNRLYKCFLKRKYSGKGGGPRRGAVRSGGSCQRREKGSQSRVRVKKLKGLLRSLEILIRITKRDVLL